MTCEEARISIHFHLDGDDHPHVRHAHAHSLSCVDCGQHMMGLREVEERLRALRRYAAPRDLRDRVLEAASDLQQKRPLSLGRLG